ncbi:MAG: glycosyltransferase family 4 protein [Sphingomicrobium sp.]
MQLESLVVVSANSIWNITNFRVGLIKGLAANGIKTVVAAPGAGSEAGFFDIAIDRSGINPLRDAALVLAYRRLLSQVRPAAYLSFTIKPNIYGAIAARIVGVPSIPNISGLGTAFLRGGALAHFVGVLYRVAFRRCAIVFFQNPDDRDLFVARRIVTPSQARVLPGSGIDPKQFMPVAGLDGGPPSFLMVARLLGDKGVREYVAAARRLRDSVPAARCRLLGPLDEGNRSAISRAELETWVAEGAIDYLGEADDVRPAIAQATAVVLPSYREGLSRTLLEAAAMGKPLVATDVPGCREVVSEGVNGALCAPRDADSLARAMMRIVALDPAKRTEMGRASRKMVQERYSESLVVAAYLDALGALYPRKTG